MLQLPIRSNFHFAASFFFPHFLKWLINPQRRQNNINPCLVQPSFSQFIQDFNNIPMKFEVNKYSSFFLFSRIISPQFFTSPLYLIYPVYRLYIYFTRLHYVKRLVYICLTQCKLCGQIFPFNKEPAIPRSGN